MYAGVRVAVLVGLALFAVPPIASRAAAGPDPLRQCRITNVQQGRNGLSIMGTGFGAERGAVQYHSVSAGALANRSILANAPRVTRWSDDEVDIEWVAAAPTGEIQITILSPRGRQMAQTNFTMAGGEAAKITDVEQTKTGLKLMGSGFGTAQGVVVCSPSGGAAATGVGAGVRVAITRWSDTEVSFDWTSRPPTGKIEIALFGPKSAGPRPTPIATTSYTLGRSESGKCEITDVEETKTGLKIMGSGFGATAGMVMCGPSRGSTLAGTAVRVAVTRWSDTEVDFDWIGPAMRGKIEISLFGPKGAGPRPTPIATTTYTLGEQAEKARITAVEETRGGLRILGSGFGRMEGLVTCEPRAMLRVARWSDGEVDVEWGLRRPTGKITLTLLSRGQKAGMPEVIATVDYTLK